MNKKVKFIILLILSIIISVALPFIVSIIPKKEEPKVDIDKLQKSFQKTLEETVKVEKEKTVKEVQEAFLKANALEDDVINSFGKIFTKYYGEDTKAFGTQYSPDKNLWNLKFNKDESGEFYTANDTGKDGWNGYYIDHTYELIDDRQNVIQKAEIVVSRDSVVKFNIYENDILIQYLNGILGREMTEKDKNAINIKVNMDFSNLKDIDDLKNYIYNTNSLKIDNMIIETENKDDVEKQRAFVTFKITCDRPVDLTPKDDVNTGETGEE